MKIILTFLVIALFNTTLFAQNDTITRDTNVIVEIYDVVAVYRETTDGRGRVRQYTTELRGEILKYDETTGLITFKEDDGKMYSFRSEDYKYFEYDREFITKIKKPAVLKPRKDSGYEFSAGLSAGFLQVPTGFQTDENYIAGMTGGFELPVCLKVGFGKYLNKNAFAGLTAEYSFLSSETSYFNVGARYQYLYNPNKNATFYFPAELKFSHYQADYYRYQLQDTTIYNNGYYSTKDVDVDVTLNALELNFGQGISFALENKRSISLELMFLKQFILSEKLKVSSTVPLKTDFSVYGMKLSLFMNF